MRKISFVIKINNYIKNLFTNSIVLKKQTFMYIEYFFQKLCVKIYVFKGVWFFVSKCLKNIYRKKEHYKKRKKY